MILRIDNRWRTQCDHEGCEELVPQGPNSKRLSLWHKRRATLEGWFFQKDDKVWCPNHNPEWVREWRAKRDAEGGT